MSNSSVDRSNKTEPYWYESPKVLLSAPNADQSARLDDTAAPGVGQRLRNAFWPDMSLGKSHPANFNRITRLSIIVAIILAIVFRSWWPIAIAAGIMFLIMLIAYGLQIQRTREARERRGREYAYGGANRNFDDNDDERSPLCASDTLTSSIDDMPNSPFETPSGSVFMSPAFPPTLQNDLGKSGASVDWGTSSYVPNAHNPKCNWPVRDSRLAARQDLNCSQQSAATGCHAYPQCGPGGPVACDSAACDSRDPRADIPNPSKHNSYDKVDARYEIYETKAQPVVAADSSLVQQLPPPQRPKSAPPVSVGIDPKSAKIGDLTANYQRPQNLSSSYMSGMGVGVPVARALGAQTQPQTQTEQMLSKMYMDKNQYGWDEMVAKRAPDWRVNPNDPRNRKALEEKELQRQSFRGLSWGMGP